MFSPPDISEMEIEEVTKTLKSGWITTGPRTKEFEREIAKFVHSDKAVCLNSATACLESILRLLGIGEGDEVILPAYTYTATASPVVHVGAKIVMIDCVEDSFEMDYEKMEDAITENTKAIIPVDLGGVVCDYETIFAAVERKKILFHPSNEIQEKIGRVIVIADAAHAFGAEKKIDGEWKKCGSIADFTSFSFHAVKNFTTAEGGALAWKDIKDIDNDWMYQQFMLLSLHGQSKDALAKTQLGAWEYDIISPSYKCNMTDIMSAIGLMQMKRYPGMLKRRKEIIKRYDTVLQPMGVKVLNHYTENVHSSGHLYLARIPGITIEQRNDIIIKMAEQGVVTNVHYKPLPMMTAYRKLGFDIKDYPNAYRQYENEITLPLHTCLQDEDVEYVVEKISCFVSQYI